MKPGDTFSIIFSVICLFWLPISNADGHPHARNHPPSLFNLADKPKLKSSPKKQLIWIQDMRGNYQFEVEKCWEKKMVSDVPTFFPSKSCSDSQSGNWELSVAYHGSLAFQQGFLAARVREFEEFGNEIYYRNKDGNPRTRVWVKEILCDSETNGDVTTRLATISPMFTEVIQANSGKPSELPPVFLQFLAGIKCMPISDRKGKPFQGGQGSLIELK